MSSYQTIEVKIEGAVGTIVLNRPEILNAINLEMIREITEVIKSFEKNDDLRVIIFRSNGEHFCSGADLNWMKVSMSQKAAQLTSESLELAKMFEAIAWSGKVTPSRCGRAVPCAKS